MNKFEQAPIFNLDKTCEAKSNAVVQAILDRNNEYKINTQHVSNKLIKAVADVINKHHLEDSQDSREVISNIVMKKALETIAQDLGGNLRQEPDLENRYLEILKDEAKDKCYFSHDEVLDTIKELDKQNILDNEKRGELFTTLSQNLKTANE